MRKMSCIFIVLLLFCAFSWPPENYEMPRTVLDAATVEESLSGLRKTAASIANTGLLLIGIITSVSLVSTIFKRLFLDKLDRFGSRNSKPHHGCSHSFSSSVDSQIKERDLAGFRRQQGHQGE